MTIVAQESSDLADLVASLRRDVLDVRREASLSAIDARSSPSVLLLAFPDDVRRDDCERAVAWAVARQGDVGLICWAPRAERGDVELALELGFDDAVGRGGSPRELAARIRAVARRVRHPLAQRKTRLRLGRLAFDVDSQVLRIDGKAVPLTMTEAAVVRALLRAGGKALNRAQLLDAAWGANFELSERAVDNVILRLRKKLGGERVVKTVRGVGFRIDGDDV